MRFRNLLRIFTQRKLPTFSRSSETRLSPWSSRRLNLLSREMAACTTYLEIGAWKGETLNHVRVPFKWGVDPDPKFRLDVLPQGIKVSKQTSDQFFRSLSENVRFDLVFLDGLHVAEQTCRDFLAALQHIGLGSVVLIDDVLPDDDLTALPDMNEALDLKLRAGITDGRWHGDVWKIIPTIHKFHPEVELVLIRNSFEARDNVQAVLWLKRPFPATPIVGAAEFLESLRTFRYSDAQKLYGYMFETVSEKEGIAKALASTRGTAAS